jgi:hypothetical protein
MRLAKRGEEKRWGLGASGERSSGALGLAPPSPRSNRPQFMGKVGRERLASTTKTLLEATFMALSK